MRFKINQGAFKQGLNVCGKALPAKENIMVLQYIKVAADDDALTLSATDMDVLWEYRKKADDSLVISESGSKCVLGKMLIGMVDHMPPSQFIEVSLTDKPDDADDELVTYRGNQLFMQSDKGKGRSKKVWVTCLNDDSQFPGDEFIPKNPVTFDIKSSNLISLLKRTSFAAGFEEMKSYLMGIKFNVSGGKISCVSSDSRRISSYECTDATIVADDLEFMLPISSANDLLTGISEDGTTRVTIGDNVGIFTQINDGWSITFKTALLSAESFPDWEKVVSQFDFDASIGFDRLRLSDTVSGVVACTRYGCDFNFDGKNRVAKIVGQESDKDGFYQAGVEDYVDCEVSVDDMIEIAIKPGYIIDGLRQMTSDAVQVKIGATSDGSSRLLLITDVDSNEEVHRYYITPIIPNENDENNTATTKDNDEVEVNEIDELDKLLDD